ncbi:MAG: phospho-sugar mutase [Clostridia bacterium]|nr:phospho-sugar mutase [Clostridia bacterium]
MTDLERKNAWLACPAMTEELRKELDGMDEASLHDSFYRNLTFGTGGLRGVLGAGTNRMNFFTVAKATRGLAEYLKEAFELPSCAVSFDSRIHSEDFARLTAAVLAESGVSVWIYPRLQPTPMLSFAVRHLHTSAGIMITASHNPAKYNGYKVYGADGCQITLEAAERTQHHIDHQPDLTDDLPDFERYLSAGAIRWITDETIEAYYQAIAKLSVKPVSEPLHLVYSPLNGTGNVPVREMMKRMKNIRVEIVTEQELPDGRFPTCPYPNPEIREAMALSIRKTVETQADFCFATDPDCDRMGAGIRVGDEVQLISGNDMGILMLDFLCRNKKTASSLPPVVVKTIVTTEMAAALCRKHGIELRNVLTGFKFIGEQIGLLEKDHASDRFLFGFEESYGYLSGTDVRDKDAVNAALLLCELASDLKAQGKTMLDRLEELRREYGFFAQRLLTFEYEGEDGANRMAAIMKTLRTGEGNKTDYLLDDTGLPKSDVIEFRQSDGNKWIVRPSGTEPKLKAYLFASAETRESAEKQLDVLEETVNTFCK